MLCFFCAVTGSFTNPSIAGGAAAPAPTRDAHAAVVHSLPPCARRRGRPSTYWFPPLAAATAACHAARHRQRCRFHVAAGVFRGAREVLLLRRIRSSTMVEEVTSCLDLVAN
jgi:hypothetical protein